MNIFEITLRSIALASAVSLFSGLLGCLFAWLVTRAEIPGRQRWAQWLALPYSVPAYLLAMAWVVIGNPTIGWLRHFLPAQGSYGFWGMVCVETTVAMTFPFLELKAGFEKLDPALEEAARMSGASPARVFRDVSFKLLWPSLLSGMALSFLYTISSFGVPALLGLPVRQFVLTTLIYSEFKMGGLTGIYNGFKLSAVLVAIVLVVLALSYALKRWQSRRGVTLVSGKASKPSQVHLGKLTIPVLMGLSAWIIITLVLPWTALGLSALASVAGDFRVSQWTLRNFKTVVTLADFQESVKNSLSYTVCVVLCLVSAGFFLGYLSVRRNKRWARVIVGASQISFALPGTVIALVLIYVSAWTGWLWDGVFWMLLAYGLKYAAIPFQMLSTGFSHVHPSLEEAAQMSGARRFKVIRDIWVPMLKTVWISAGVLVALPILTELTMSVLLTGPGRATLGTVLFQLQEYADQPSAAAMGFLILSFAVVGAWIQSTLISKRKNLT